MLRLIKVNGSLANCFLPIGFKFFFQIHALAGPTIAISMRTSQVQSGIARKKERKLENLSKV
jgi:hypothetical protein